MHKFAIAYMNAYENNLQVTLHEGESDLEVLKSFILNANTSGKDFDDLNTLTRNTIISTIKAYLGDCTTVEELKRYCFDCDSHIGILQIPE